MMEQGKISIIEEGQARAVILLEQAADPLIAEAAGVLADYLDKAAGARLAIEPKREGWEKEYPASFAAVSLTVQEGQCEGKAADGYRIFSSGRVITIAGSTALGCKYGVFEFLERYVGVRWLMPGEIGEEVPKLRSLAIPGEQLEEQPAFMSRDVVGFLGYHMQLRNEAAGAEQMKWLDRNRNHPAIHFHHQLYKLFPPEKYAASHPDFFPQKGGVPRIPAENMGWQPSFTHPGVVEEAIKNIVDYFKQNPDAISYSLGMTDSDAEGSGFCEQAVRKNSIGLDDMSDIYYAWVNKVAEGVLQVFPDKYFGLLAYAEVLDPPSFPLHPRVIPMITDDRYTWIDERRREEGTELMRRWQEKAEAVAWYDYIYGSPYIAPRVFNRRMAENLRFAAKEGVAAYFGEAYPNFAEGPKWWMLMRLLWNPEQDEAALAREWCQAAVGSEAAEDLLQYYEYWEQFWATRAFGTPWYRNWLRSNPRYPFMPFNNASYAADITVEEMEECRRLMEAVVRKAGSAKQKLRAALLMKGFELYEASVLSYPAVRHIEVPEEPEQAADLLERLLQREMKGPAAMAEKRMQLIEQFESDPVLVQVMRGPQDQAMTWTGHENFAFLAQWIAMEDEESLIIQQLHAIAGEEKRERRAQIAKKLLHYRGRRLQLHEASVGGHTGAAEEASAAVETGMPEGGGKLVKHFILDRQLDYVSVTASFYTPLNNGSNCMLSAALIFQSEAGEDLLALASDIKFCSYTTGEWSDIRMYDAVPEKIRKDVRRIQLNIHYWGLAAGQSLSMDHIQLHGIF